jgi:precorrin-6Y C5,15-methyltransferase (decarboxylating)
VIAIECLADAHAPRLSRLAGLPDSAFQHDGQLTKRDVRAITLARLAPIPGELLWDVGGGCGSIGIEWMRAHPSCRAIAIEADEGRQALIEHNRDARAYPACNWFAAAHRRRSPGWSAPTRSSSAAA